MSSRKGGHDGAGVGEFAESIVGAWVKAGDSTLSDLLAGGLPAFFDLVTLPGPRGLQETEVRAVTTAALARSLTMGSPARDTVASMGRIVCDAAARAKGPPRFEVPEDYDSEGRALLLSLLLAFAAEGGR